MVRVAVAPLVLRSLRLERGQRDGLLVRPQDTSVKYAVHVRRDLAGRHVLGLDPHPDLDRRSAGGVDGRSERDDVADLHGRAKPHRVHRDGHHASAAMANARFGYAPRNRETQLIAGCDFVAPDDPIAALLDEHESDVAINLAVVHGVLTDILCRG